MTKLITLPPLTGRRLSCASRPTTARRFARRTFAAQRPSLIAGLMAAALACGQALAQQPSASDGSAAPPAPAQSAAAQPEPLCGIAHLVRCFEDLGQDDEGIFTSPLHLQPRDAYWLMPLGAATGLAFAYDSEAAQAVGVNTGRINTANTISNFGSFYATGAEGAGIYFLGMSRKDPKLEETGRLGAEAVIDAGTVTLAGKLIADRQRPSQGNGKGGFWVGGPGNYTWDTSFPSDHAASTMALARVLAGEYPHWYVAAPAYGFAEGISIARIFARAHFPSDIVVGQAVGFLTGTYVLNHRALYRPGKSGAVARMLRSAHPIADPQSHALGAAVEIPFGN